MNNNDHSITHQLLEKASLILTREDVANAIFNLSDACEALRAKELNRKIDEDTDCTIGELLSDVALFLQQLEDGFCSE